MGYAIGNTKQAFNDAVQIANDYINILWSQDKNKAQPLHIKLQTAFNLHRQAINKLEQLQTELVCANELCGGYEAELAKAKVETEWLKKALGKYGQHLSDCEIVQQPFLSAAGAQWECTCGFEQTLKGKQ